MQKYDIILIGAGIVGAASARGIQTRFPNKKILVLEKESTSAQHQTGRNSGVIHAGVYYQPGSLKAKYCREGMDRTYAFCEQYQIPVLRTGKLLVACNDLEVERMQPLIARCEKNDLQPQTLDKDQLHKAEPNISGEAAMLVKHTGITHYRKITQTLLGLFQDAGGAVRYAQKVQHIEEQADSIHIVTEQGEAYQTSFLVNCAGLYADHLIRKMGISVDFQVLPFRGEYFRLKPHLNQVVRHLIYPIPDPAFPFLGVHLTRMIDGSVTVGPNAVLATAREGYSKTKVNFQEMGELLSFKGTWPLMKQNVRAGLAELRNSWFTSAYLEQVRKYCPSIKKSDLLSYPSGVRAQAVSQTGELIHDFKFVESQRSLHIGNAPSPAATSAMPIADAIVEKLAQRLS